MKLTGPVLAAVAVIAIAVALVLVFSQEEPGRTAGDLNQGSDVGVTPAEAPALLRAEGSTAPGRSSAADGASPESSAEGDAAARSRLSPAMTARLKSMMETVAALDAALAVERTVEETETNAEEALREEAWSRMVDEVKNAVRSIPALATALYESTAETESDAMAIRLARILQSAAHPEFVDRLRVDAVDAAEPRRRRMAIVALEMRDAKVFLEPVASAYAQDADPLVRDEAAGVLSRSMMDRKHVRSHVEIRTTVQSALASDTPADRARAVRALMADTRAGPDELKRIQALAKDPDADVRREVQRAIRVLTPRVERALKRR